MKKIIFLTLLLTGTYVYAYNNGQARPPSNIDCYNLYDPVCALPPLPNCLLNNMCKIPQPGPTTYSNECVAKSDGSKILYKGECESKKDKLGEDNLKKEIPDNCITWFDGCNTCGRADNGIMMMCTMMACMEYSKPYCIKFADDSNLNKEETKELEINSIDNSSESSNKKNYVDNDFSIVKKIQKKKLLGIFTINLSTELLIDNDSGEIIRYKNPWYSFLLF